MTSTNDAFLGGAFDEALPLSESSVLVRSVLLDARYSLGFAFIGLVLGFLCSFASQYL